MKIDIGGAAKSVGKTALSLLLTAALQAAVDAATKKIGKINKPSA